MDYCASCHRTNCENCAVCPLTIGSSTIKLSVLDKTFGQSHADDPRRSTKHYHPYRPRPYYWGRESGLGRCCLARRRVKPQRPDKPTIWKQRAATTRRRLFSLRNITEETMFSPHQDTFENAMNDTQELPTSPWTELFQQTQVHAAAGYGDDQAQRPTEADTPTHDALSTIFNGD